MIRTIVVEAAYGAPADRVFEQALDVSEMQNAMQGLAIYEGLPDRKIVEGDKLCVDVTFLNLFKSRNHVMYVERLDRGARVVQSREYNPTIKRWDHTLSVQPVTHGCLWRDTIVLDAGATTWLTAWFCRFVYTRRHRMRDADSIRALIVRGDINKRHYQ